MSKNQELNETVIIKCTKEFKEELKNLAHYHKMNQSELIRYLITNAIDSYKEM